MHLAHRTLCRGSLLVGARAVRHRCLLSSSASQSSNDTVTTQPQAAQQQQPLEQRHTCQQQEQQQPHMPQVPSLMEMLSTHGTRLTTAAQMVWAQVLQPGDVAVDATCGNGHDSLFMAQCIGPTGHLHAVDLQASAVAATRDLLSSSLPGPQQPSTHLHQSCHSQLQALVGSNTAALVAFNLGYLPGGDKALITRTDTTTAAVEAALEVVRPGGLVSIMCYIGHPGGLEEYEAVRDMLAGLSPSYWTSSELRLLNRPSAPVLVLLWRRPDAGRRGPAAA